MEYSLFQQSDNEFVSLRPYPDISMASETFKFVPHNCSPQASEHGVLSLLEAPLGPEDESSCCSLSQHSFSPSNDDRPKRTSHSSLSVTADRREAPPRDDTEPVTDPQNHPGVEAAEDEAFFLNKEIPAQHLLKLLQKDVGMLTDSSSTTSSASVISGNIIPSISEEPKSSQTCKEAIPPTETPLEPPCDVSLPQQQSDRDSSCGTPEASNISTGPRSTRPDHSSDALHRQLLKEAEQGPLPAAQPGPHPTGLSRGRPGHPHRVPSKGSWRWPFSVGVERSHKDQRLCSLGNQTDIEGSYLGFLPQSQSTPGVFNAPSKSGVKAKAEQLSAIESSKENYSQSDAGIPPQSRDHKMESDEEQESVAPTEVPSLPSVGYMQKVDAWRSNQTSGKTSLLDSLALQAFSGVSPKKRDHSAISESLTRLLGQNMRSLPQPLVSVPANHSVAESSSAVPSVVSSVAADDAGSSKGPSGLLPTASQSQSSPSTRASGRKGEGTKSCSEDDKSLAPDDPSTTAHLPALRGLGHDVTLSQDSNSSGIRIGTSIGTSSVVSLEVDNYAPYWTSKPSTPPPQPRSRELNIEERIPLYLHNLGIDQSPSTILTPFVPRGPIREPEFSPTDLCTIKGSIGTPSKSTQPSEGDSPNKGEFSGCSVMSVDSSISIAFSLDSLGPGAPIPEQIAQPSTSDTDRQNHLLSSPPLDEDSYPSTLQTTLQQRRDSSLTSSQNTIQLGDRFDSDASLSPEGRDSEASFRPSRTEFTEASLVRSEPMLGTRNLLTQAENVLSAGSCVASTRTSHRSQSSQLWARSSSDSMLTSAKLRENPERESVRSSPVADHPSAAASCRGQENSSVVKGAASALMLSESVQRTEPEGCSAAPPDNTVPPGPAPTAPSGPGPQQLPPAADTEEEEEEEEEEEAAVEGPGALPLLKEEDDQGVVSDGSSGSSLARKVTQLLRSQSAASVVSSTSSTTDQEERKAREWIKLKVSGQHCEPLELHEEDRRRIEEIKKELLLRSPMKSWGSTDTDSTSSCSFRLQRELDPARTKQTQTLSPRTDLLPQLQNLSCLDLEAQIREIAAREGVTLTRTPRRAFASITIASRRRSSSPSSSASPELLHLSELSTDAVDGDAAEKLPPTTEEHRETEPTPAFEPGSLLSQGNQSQTSQLQPGTQTRQVAFGGQLEEADVPSKASSREPDTDTQSVGHGEESTVQYGCVSARGAKEEAAPSPPESPAPSGHVSHVHLALSPRTSSHRLIPLIPSPHTDSDPAMRPEELLSVMRRSSASSPDEGVGLSSPLEWCRNTELMRQQGLLTLYRTGARLPSAIHREVVSPQTTEAALPVLLPYKPSGSEELFYIPQTEAALSSDTTMESSHPGSDDAVPPRFSGDVLGYGDPEISRGVTTRHAEGIYSRRLETSTYQMQEAEPRAESTSQTNGNRPLPPSSPVTTATVLRDQGTSPVNFPSYGQSEFSHERFQRIHEEVNDEKSSNHLVPSVVPQSPDQNPPPTQSSSTLDQLWERFCSRWHLEDSQPTSNREASLLERLERLSRLIHNTRGSKAPASSRGSEDGAQRREDGREDEAAETQRRLGEARKTEAESGPVRWVEHPNGCSHGAARHQHLCPADRDETDTVSTSGSISTVDTARLVRAFGSHRVQLLKTSCSLRKLYSTIDKQRERREQRGGRSEEQLSISAASRLTQDSTVSAESAFSTGADSVPSHSHLGPSRTLRARTTVEVANKGIQAGDLELICDGTRRHTRDVGTTFPSPAESRLSRHISSSSSILGGPRGWSKPPKAQKRRKSKKSPSKFDSQGVSWFIPAEELRAEGRKENCQEDMWRPSTSWFEPCSRTKPWREPLRQRRGPEEENKPTSWRRHDPQPRLKPASSGPAALSLQEALAARRPDFISQSRQRLQRLALQAEERKLQEEFSRRREEHLSRPGGAPRQLKPAGTRRAVPRTEMIQRSKQIYNNLPEVRKRREEQRRRAQYDTYRLNARLYNKRITSHVLGRRTAWQ
ncbi:mucin-19 isoform X2 [Takifugu flavidus]|nr:mucin-19 isoform X2 [Takifugu flavidus]XP_056868007.1 mucin-19 isoform X2 [Takifugu flavidus]